MTDAVVAWETARLVARRATRDVAQDVFDAYAQDAEVARYMIWRPHREVDETIAFLDRCERAWQDGTAFSWTLWLKEDGCLAGMIEARLRGSSADIGYVLRRSLWRRGLMTEAIRFVIDWALSLPGVYRVWATCDVENVASARLLESVGMEREGVLRRWIVHPNMSDTPRDALCYAIVR
jgi:ribosomal-protein-alanine N-acetyltransferase